MRMQTACNMLRTCRWGVRMSAGLGSRSRCCGWTRGGCQHHSQPQRERRYSTSRCRASADDGKGVAPPNIRDLARMAQLSVTDEEVKEWEPKLQQIVSWFDQLQAVDVEGVPPAVRADVGEDNVLRPDVPAEYSEREALLSQVPDKEGEFVKVPKIV